MHYTIKVSKDHRQVTASWDINVDMSDTELISNFTLTVDSPSLECQGTLCYGLLDLFTLLLASRSLPKISDKILTHSVANTFKGRALRAFSPVASALLDAQHSAGHRLAA